MNGQWRFTHKNGHPMLERVHIWNAQRVIYMHGVYKVSGRCVPDSTTYQAHEFAQMMRDLDRMITPLRGIEDQVSPFGYEDYRDDMAEQRSDRWDVYVTPLSGGVGGGMGVTKK